MRCSRKIQTFESSTQNGFFVAYVTNGLALTPTTICKLYKNGFNIALLVNAIRPHRCLLVECKSTRIPLLAF